jgi:hypothetical protein
MMGPAADPIGCNRITVDDCRFIGENDNRNGISIVYARDVTVTNCHFYRMTNTTMPGPIDIEPDTGTTVRDVLIDNNHFYHPTGTLVGAAVLVASNGSGYTIENVSVTNNTMRGTSTTLNLGVRIKGASADVRSINVEGNMIYGTVFAGIQSEGTTKPTIRGNYVYGANRGITTIGTSIPRIEGNTLISCFNYGVRQDSATAGGEILNNRIFDCGSSTAGTAGISITSTTPTRVLGNTIDATDATNYMRYGIAVTTGSHQIDDNYVNNAATNPYFVSTTTPQLLGFGNVWLNGTNSIAGTYPPTSGTWTAGTKIKNMVPSGFTAVFGWHCWTGGTPGSWWETSRPPRGTMSARTDTALILASSSAEIQRWTGALTANRLVTLPNAELYNGLCFEIWRDSTATGAFNLTIQTAGAVVLKTLTAAGQSARFVCDGTNWHVVPVPDIGVGQAIGAFSAIKSGSQNDIPDQIDTKITFDAEEFDVSGWYDTTTSRYTPLQAGYYNLTAGIRITPAVADKFVIAKIYKNGTSAKRLLQGHTSNATGFQGAGSATVFADGVDDYFEVYFFHNFGVATSDIVDVSTGSGAECYFQGAFIGTA